MRQEQENIVLTADSRALVVGLGKTGLSCARFLAGKGVRLAITDSRDEPPGLAAVREELPDAALFLGGFDATVFAKADLVVVSPGVPVATAEIQQAMAKGIPVVGDVELFAMSVETPVAAITGSNGKSTVTTLLGLMARAAGLNTAVGGNLGEPVLTLLQSDVDLYVLELSSFQLETTASLRSAVAAVLNVSADHMDRYRDLDHYADTKARILEQAEVAVLNKDDPRVLAMDAGGETFLFSLKPADENNCFNVRDRAGESWLCCGREALLRVSELQIPGRHNQANALAALAMGTALNISREIMLQVLREFRGLPHRTEFIGVKDGVRWYNDSKGTNPGATIAALEGLADTGEGKIVLIAGGECKQADFSKLGEVIEQTARAVVLLGADADRIRSVVPVSITSLPAADLSQAVELAAANAVVGDCVLLSPACASFDMFRNYEQRGDLFREVVLRWLQ